MASDPGPTQLMGGGWNPHTVEELQKVLPQYEVIEMLGRGGMGAVYKARQRSLKRLVAIKVLPVGVADDECKFVERFRNEAQTLAQLNHPAIVNVHDFGETPDGLLYFAMEFVDGTDVNRMIAANGRLPVETALAITAHVCDALAYAHRHNVIHRDIKPANVLINHEGHVKVADFGLAKVTDTAMESSGLTLTNMTMGTPGYAAPEVFTPGVETDHRADLYAVGVMLYQMLTGEVPRGMFKLPSQKGIGSDPRFDEIICRAMEQDRTERYQSAIEVRQALDQILSTPLAKDDGEGAIPANAIVLRVDKTPALSPAPVRPGKAKWMAVAAMAAVLAIGGWVVIGMKGKSPATVTAGARPGEAAFLATVAAAPAATQVELVRQKIEEINGAAAKLTPTFKQDKVTNLVVHAEAPNLWPLAALRDLDGLQIYAKKLSDISWLRGMTVTLLTIGSGEFTEIGVLRELPLTHLDLPSGRVRDYQVLKGKPLIRLRLSGSPVDDLSFIAGMPLKELWVDKTEITDLSPIREMALTELKCDFVPARDAEIVRSISTLKKINDKTTAEFWASHGAGPAWTDWLGPKLADPTDFRDKTWKREADGVSHDEEIVGRMILPEGTKDAAIRVTYQLRGASSFMIGFREKKAGDDRDSYVADDTGKYITLARNAPGAKPVRLGRQAIPPEISPADERTMEVRFQGSQMSVTLNGVCTLTTQDDALAEGSCAVVVKKGTLVKRVELQALDAAR